ncbi:hypothetical protein A4X03_0g9823, partial [Tilletia caries]
MRLFSRVRSARGPARASWIALTAIIGGSSIWTTHFVAMMGYEADALAGYEPTATLLSLVLAIMITGVGLFIAAVTARSFLIEAGGALVGAGIASMHYVGMSGYQVQADLHWNMNYVWASLVAAGLFGALATNRVARPVTRFCRYGGGAALSSKSAVERYRQLSLHDALTGLPNRMAFLERLGDLMDRPA